MFKLIVVDDEYEIRNGLCNYFSWSEIGFEVSGQFENGRMALDFIMANKVDAMLCDIRMPVMDGIELMKEIYERKINIKVVFLSSYREFEYAQKALSFGVRDYIIKPTQHKQLFDVFSKLRIEMENERIILEKMGGMGMGETSGSSNPGYYKQIIDKVKEYVLSNYLDPTLEGAAELIYMNPHYLSKLFKEKTGENFSDYITKVRMQKAAGLLSSIEYKTYDVSELVGYSNAKNFTRAFKKYYGKTPKEFRNS